MDLEDLGKIKRMTLPENWEEEENRNQFDETQTFVHPTEKEVKLSFYYRGKPVSSRTAGNLKDLLAKPAHDLDRNEIESIEVVLRDASEPEYFELKSARTIDLNGARILIVEGFWKLSELSSFGVFIDSEEEGTRIDEIYFLAPPDKYSTYLPILHSSLNSILWNLQY